MYARARRAVWPRTSGPGAGPERARSGPGAVGLLGGEGLQSRAGGAMEGVALREPALDLPAPHTAPRVSSPASSCAPHRAARQQPPRGSDQASPAARQGTACVQASRKGGWGPSLICGAERVNTPRHQRPLRLPLIFPHALERRGERNREASATRRLPPRGSRGFRAGTEAAEGRELGTPS